VLVEFALALPILLLIVVGVVDFGMLFQEYQVVTNAAREGARMAVLQGFSEGDITNRVQDYLTAGGVTETPIVDVGDPELVTPAGGGTPYTARRVTVDLTHTFGYLSPIASLFGGEFDTVTLRGTSVMRTEVAAGGG
jgi:Flp pilus assembly protein TadG